jgi:hypothetical protein
MTTIRSSRVEQFLAGVAKQPLRRGNLVFALDATASREKTWDAAAKLTAQMFREVATVGSLSMQLVYFRGVRDAGGECKASRWVEDPMELAGLMTGIKCVAGETQIERVLAHVSRETSRLGPGSGPGSGPGGSGEVGRKINALVFVGDCCEEDRDVLAGGTAELGKLGVPAFMFQEGADPVGRRRFEEIARATGGAYHQFNQGSLQQLADLLRAVATFSVGGVVALERQGGAAAKLLLQQMESSGRG